MYSPASKFFPFSPAFIKRVFLLGRSMTAELPWLTSKKVTLKGLSLCESAALQMSTLAIIKMEKRRTFFLEAMELTKSQRKK